MSAPSTIIIDESFFTNLLKMAHWCASQGNYDGAESYARAYADHIRAYRTRKKFLRIVQGGKE